MIVEILNVGIKNKGAELMLHAVMQQMRTRYPGVVFTCVPSKKKGHFPIAAMRRMGICPKLQGAGAIGFLTRLLAALSAPIAAALGCVRDRDVDVVLDASGFAYGDQWGVSSNRRLAKSSSRWAKNGTDLFLLPQAFGPFEDARMHPYIREWASNARAIFAREEPSKTFLTSVVGHHEKIKKYGDFTNLLAGTVPDYFDPSNKRVALVPNSQMIKKVGQIDGAAYLPFMVRCATYLHENGAMPFMLVHQTTSDNALAEAIAAAAGGIPIVREEDPLALKGILGLCDATVGSRFHGLVSALSQGVPALATGWSHKYVSLFEDYGFAEGVIDVNLAEDALFKKLDLLIDEKSKRELRKRLTTYSQELKSKSKEMWELIFDEIS